MGTEGRDDGHGPPGPGDVVSSPPLREEDVLARRLDQALAALDAASGTSSLCSLSKSGLPMPGIKYPEGAWIALREVTRAVREPADIPSVTCAVRDRWSADLARHEAAGSGVDWIAYLTGGLDALDDVILAMTSPAPSDHPRG